MSDLIQFQPAIRPGAEVEQQVTASVATPTPSAVLPAVIIGILNKKVAPTKATTYTKTAVNTQYLFTGYEAAARIYADSIQLRADNIEYLIAPSSKRTTATRTGSAVVGPVSGNIITDAAATFTTTAAVGDTLEINEPGFTSPIEATIVTVTSDTALVISVDLTLAPGLSLADAITYRQLTVGSATVLANGGDNNQLQDSTTGTSFTLGANVNDEVEITHVSIGTVVTKVNVVNSATVATVALTLPAALVGQTVTYRLKRSSGVIASPNTDRLVDNTVTTPFAITEPGDTVSITHPSIGLLSATVVEVFSATEIKLDKAFPVSTNIAYNITRKNSTSLLIINNKLGSFTLATGETVTDTLVNTDPLVNFGTVNVGDSVRIVRGSNITSATVIAVPDITRVQLNTTFTGGSVFYTIKRTEAANSPEVLELNTHYTLLDVDSDGFVDDPAFTILGNMVVNTLPVSSADIMNSYKMLSRKDANVVLEVDDSTREQLVGDFDPADNPLGSGVFLAMNNTGTKVYAIPVEEDSSEGWANALSAAENNDLYNIALMTQNSTYQSYLRDHVDSMSTALKHNWRIGWSNLPHPYEGITVTRRSGGTLSYVVGVPNYLTLFDPLANFSDSRIGGYIEVKFTVSNVQYTKYLKITDKINNTTLKCEDKEYNPPLGVQSRKGAYLPGATITAAGFNGAPVVSLPIQVQYEAFYTLSLAEQALTIANIAYGFARRRIMYVTNETCTIEVDGVTNEYPGYYLCAAYAGASSGTPPHQPLTYYTLNGIKGVRKGQDWFKDTDHQGIIVKGGGWLVVSRTIDDGLPFAWKQTTTDTSSIKTTEFSFTKNFDEITKAVYRDLNPFAGRNNRVGAAISRANSQTVATLDVRTTNDTQSAQGNGDLGPQILGYTFAGHVEDELIADLTYTDIELDLPITWNRLKIVLRA